MKNSKIFIILSGLLVTVLLTFSSCENVSLDEISKNAHNQNNHNEDFSFEKSYLVFKSKESFMETLKNIDSKEIKSKLEIENRNGFSPLNNIYLKILNEYNSLSKNSNENNKFDKNNFNQEVLYKYGNSFIIKDENIFPNTFNFNLQKLVNEDRIVKIGNFMYQFEYDKVRKFKSMETISVKELEKIHNSNSLVDLQKIIHKNIEFSQKSSNGNQNSINSSARVMGNNYGTIQFNNFISQGGFFGTNYLDSKIDCKIEMVYVRFPDCDYNPDDRGHGPVGSEYTCYDGYEWLEFLQVYMRHTATSSSLFGGNNTDSSCPDGIRSMEIEGYINSGQGNNNISIYTGSGTEVIQTVIGDYMITNERKRIFQRHHQYGVLKFTANVFDVFAPNVYGPKDITLNF